MTLKTYSMFSGIGGFDLGLEKTGCYTITAQAEWNQYSRKVLKEHWPHTPMFSDVREINYEQPEFSDIDTICAGFPCQPVSFQGAKKGTADARWLWPEVLRAIRGIRPALVILENVVGILSAQKRRIYGLILGEMAATGYNAEWACIPAKAFGAPHQRDRWFLVAYPIGKGQQGSWGCIESVNPTPDAYREAGDVVDAVQGDTVPFVCKRHDGVSSGLAKDQLTALGNALTPQQAEYVGRCALSFLSDDYIPKWIKNQMAEVA